MSKRQRDQERDGRPAKRAKQSEGHKPPPAEEIQFARQLQNLLAFRQDGLQQLRHGIASFKAFLDSILYQKSEDDRARQLSILREYLESEKPADPKDVERPFLRQLWQAWSFANQNHNDYLASSISAILALLLKTLSNLLDFRVFGLILCRTVLQQQHLRLIRRCLDAPKQKDFVISPCLRLLIEITSFDGGVLAREVYKSRELTFDVGVLRRNLGILKLDVPAEEQQKKPSIRTWTIRYILAHLKYLHEGGKIDVLKNRALCTGLFQHLKDDPPDLVDEILAVVEQNVLKDAELPRSAKAGLLLQQNLERVVDVATRSQEDHPSRQKAFDWLKAICSNPSCGLFRSSGWYPPGTASVEGSRRRRDETIDLGLDSIDFYDREGRPAVRNTVLLAWLQALRPHSNLQERELVLTCFDSAPELVATYFSEKTIQLDPKLSNTWVGYASFLFEAVRLAVPKYFGNEEDWTELPPQTTIMIENILPQPLTQKVLTRCLNQSSELITFFAARLLVLAFEKLAQIRSQLQIGAEASPNRPALWQAASDQLLTRFVERCPNIKDGIAAFRKTPDDHDHILQREALARLIQLYYEVTPLQAMEEQFDISSTLAAALVRSQSESDDPKEIQELSALELDHLLQIATHSSGIRWFAKQGSLEFSPILTLLQIHRKDHQNQRVRELIYYVLSENGVMSSNSACDALVACLIDVEDELFLHLAPYLDDWLARASKKPVKYLDDLESFVEWTTSSDELPSPFVAVLLEQAPFVLADKDFKKELMMWINTFIEVLSHTGEQCPVLKKVREATSGLEGWQSSENYSKEVDLLSRARLPEPAVDLLNEPTQVEQKLTTIPFSAPPVESEDHPELFRWTKKELDTALEGGDIDSLILCLCSQYPDIRVQGRAQLQSLLIKVRDSSVEDKDALHVLIGELIETYERHYQPKSEALPYLAGTFATNALHVLMRPTHFIYPKINKYLNKGPEWRVQKLPSYWIESTMLSQPEDDDAYWREIQWVLSWLVDGLRTQKELDILRKAGVFEQLMSLYASPGAAAKKDIRSRVLELLWRATFVEEGSTTLITRTGVLSWLVTIRGGEDQDLKALKRRIIETCDSQRVEKWSGLSLDKL